MGAAGREGRVSKKGARGSGEKSVEFRQAEEIARLMGRNQECKDAFQKTQNRAEEVWRQRRASYKEQMGEQESYCNRMAQVNKAFSRDGGGFFYLLQQLGSFLIPQDCLPDKEGRQIIMENLMSQIKRGAKELDKRLALNQEETVWEDEEPLRIDGSPYKKTLRYLDAIEEMEKELKKREKRGKLSRHYEILWERTKFFLMNPEAAGGPGDSEERIRCWYGCMRKLLASCGIWIVFCREADEEERAKWFAQAGENAEEKPAIVGTKDFGTGEYVFCLGVCRMRQE